MNYFKPTHMFFKRSVVLSAAASAILAGCGSQALILPEFNQDALTNTIGTQTKKGPVNEDMLKSWGHADLATDTLPGMSVERAYRELLSGKIGTTVIVGVIDSGVDFAHEDLKEMIWTNTDEIPGNGIDDDKNGYIDDVHGWNFLGEATHENLEFTRIVKKGEAGSPLYAEAKKEYDEKYEEALGYSRQYETILQSIDRASAYIEEKLGFSPENSQSLASVETDNDTLKMAVGYMNNLFSIEDDKEKLIELLNKDLSRFSDQMEYNLNTEFDGRAVVGDNPDDFTDVKYGNNNVTGDVEHSRHGTHVAGIVGAQRNNGIGMNGVAQQVQIMSLRAVPDGDEYDKDIALAIRYAVDNGAKVINGSFGKYYSPHADKVREAIKYAASKDVLIIKAAGNESYFLDEKNVYPNDNENNSPEVSDNFLTVGALNYKYGPQLVAPFSNYGKIQVDVFAPGMKIWSTTPNGNYEFLQGTSMAAPAVAGVAAVIRSYYPTLSAAQVKQIIMRSGLESPLTVIVAGDEDLQMPFAEISKSGKMVNLYNAILLADKVARKKVKL